MLIQPEWIAVDWGTSRLRAWAMTVDGAELAMRASDQGMGHLAPSDFAPTLAALLDDWLTSDKVIPVLICGMAGSRQGWIEAPYLPVPSSLSALCEGIVEPPGQVTGAWVRIVPGLAQSDPPDVMRGEETQLAGLLALVPDFAGAACLPGTHGKWVTLAEGQVQRFQTCITGELFALLSRQSILRHSLADGDVDGRSSAFRAGVQEGLSDRLMLSLFPVRARSLLEDRDPVSARDHLSGLLIGAEVAAMAPHLEPMGTPVQLIGGASLSRCYEIALAEAGIHTATLSGESAVLAGLDAIRRQLNN